MLLSFQDGFLNFFPCSKQVPIFHHHFVDTPKASLPDLTHNVIIIRELFLFHFYKLIPFHLNFIYLSFIYSMRIFMIVLSKPNVSSKIIFIFDILLLR